MISARLLCFCFKQKTAYEMRISDWSSDVCSSDLRGNLLARRARNTGRVDVDRTFGKFAFGASLKGASHRFDNAANTVRLGGYATFDLRVSYAFDPDWTLEARVDNAFDRDYETVAWYNQPGREYGLSLRWAPVR